MVADMLELPAFGEFDLVWALDDAINYLLSPEELERALAGMRANLAPTGLLLFDVNELLAYRTFFAETEVVERGGRRLVWSGLAAKDVAPGSICESRLEVARRRGRTATAERRCSPTASATSPKRRSLAALERAGLECLDVYGHGHRRDPKQPLDDTTHTKAIYIARSAA